MSEARLYPSVAIVDDEQDLVDVYTRLFRLKKITVCFVAGNGQEAVDAYRQSRVKPDIVIMDNRMPLMNGLDAMKAIMAIDRKARFIFMSADASVREQVTAMGALFLKKPASLQELMRAIESLSGGHDGSGSCDGGTGNRGNSPGTACL
ncbi:MAG: acetoacetate metabolism regulatory protein AtoC [Methanocella sp. PtaU1.Bin125]|nr:MAG: acetoacetate metabolism regulatory protein AtoC [Methanocella sp. PtaU1.Bin125]